MATATTVLNVFMLTRDVKGLQDKAKSQETPVATSMAEKLSHRSKVCLMSNRRKPYTTESPIQSKPKDNLLMIQYWNQKEKK